MRKNPFFKIFSSNLFILCLAYHLNLLSAPLSLALEAESVILMNPDNGAILYEKEAHKLQYPASITKIATAVYGLKLMKGSLLNQTVEAQQEALASVTEAALRKSNYSLPAYRLIPGGSSMGIKVGEELSIKDLFHGMLLVSGNDASNVIAMHLAGSIPQFMEGLNKYIKEIGCSNTVFCNPHGLYHPEHQTTAYDMALIMKEGLRFPAFREIIGKSTYKRPKTNKQEATNLLQSNKLVRKGKHYYAKALGGKTGYLSHAQHTLVVAAQDDSRTLIAVLLKHTDRDRLFQETIQLFEAAFAEPKVEKTFLKTGLQKETLDLPGATSPIHVYIKKDLKIQYYPAEEPQVRCLLSWKSISPPIHKDQEVGHVFLETADGRILEKVPLFAQEEVSTTWSWWARHLFK